ncbi:MAG: STAS domain-containing protein [Nitrospira sp.]|nr:STAS domain-containing protein [Nitrospira sp.]
MHVAERIQHDTLILMISGRVTFYSRKVFQALVKTAKFSSAKHVIFNLEGVTFLDSTALGGLALAYLSLQESGIAMSLVSPTHDVQHIMASSNFPNFIPTYPTEGQALEAHLAEPVS